VAKPERPSGKRDRRTDRRDFLMVATIAVAAFSVGAWLNATIPLSAGDLEASLGVALGGMGVIAIIRWRQASKERRLRGTAEANYRMLVEQVPAITYSWDPTMPTGTQKPLFVSPQVEQILGYTPREWMTSEQFWIDRIHPDDRERVVAASDASDRLGTPFVLEYRMLAKDGGVVWLRDEATIVADRQGLPTRAQGVMYDITERKQAEEQLLAAEERYRTLVEQLPAVVYIDAIDELSTALYISPQYERVFGFTPQQRTDDPGLWIRQIHPDDQDRVVAESERTNRTGDPFNIEYRWIRHDGTTIWVHDQASQVEGAGGVRVWQGVLTDITERKSAQDALTRRDQILQAAGLAAERFLRSPSWVDCIDEVLARVGEADGASRAFVFRNDRLGDGRLAMTKIFEWNAPGIEPTLHEPHNAAYPYDDGYADWEAMLPQGTVVQGLRQKLEPRQREWLEREGVHSSLAVPVFVGGGWWGFIGLDQCDEERDWQPAEVEALRVVASTLGAAIGRVHAADRLTETENRYRTLIEQLPTATFMTSVDMPHDTLYMSPQIETILGYSAEEWTSDIWHRSLHPEDAERVLAEDARTSTSGDNYSIEYRLRARDGRWVWVHDDAQRVLDPTGRPAYWQGVRADITERKEAEQQLREAEERFRRLVEQLPAITYVDAYDPAHKDVWPTSYISPQVEAILGYSADEWRSDPHLWAGLVHPEDRERVNLANGRHPRGGRGLAAEPRHPPRHHRAQDCRAPTAGSRAALPQPYRIHARHHLHRYGRCLRADPLRESPGAADHRIHPRRMDRRHQALERPSRRGRPGMAPRGHATTQRRRGAIRRGVSVPP